MKKEICDYIDRGCSFALYRLPGEDKCRIIRSTGAAEELYGYHEFKERSGFIFAPFRLRKETPVLLIKGEPQEVVITADPSSASTASPEENSIKEEKERYLQILHQFMTRLDGGMQKLVLSRKKEENYPGKIALTESFAAALKQYPNAFVYLCYTPQAGIWMGATPEILLEIHKERGHTVALAGTQPLENGRAPQVWSSKNREEQEYVAKYLREIFKEKGMEAVEKGPAGIIAGEIAHLKSDFFFTAGGEAQTGALTERLHPTPAVCGLPKRAAYEFICRNEGYDRRYYSGFLGVLHHQCSTELFVNLRCIEIAPSLRKAAFYAGGGILKGSVPEEEWRETERKMNTMRSILIAEKEEGVSEK